MNRSLKMVAKGMNKRFAPVDDKIIDKSQATFMQIYDGRALYAS
jgi:hypothetical protein